MCLVMGMLTVPAGAALFFDDFNRPDDSHPGYPWVDKMDPTWIESGKLVATYINAGTLTVIDGLSLSDAKVDADAYADAPSNIVLRYNPANGDYLVALAPNWGASGADRRIYFGEWVGGGWVRQTTALKAPVGGDIHLSVALSGQTATVTLSDATNSYTTSVLDINPALLGPGLIGVSHGGGPAQLGWDNFTIDAVPEPGSFVALAASLTGFAGLIRRRKR